MKCQVCWLLYWGGNSVNRHLAQIHPIPAPGKRSHNYLLSFDKPSCIGCPPHVPLKLLQCCSLPVHRHLPVHVVYDCLDDPLQLLFPTSTLQRDWHGSIQTRVLLSLEIIHDNKRWGKRWSSVIISVQERGLTPASMHLCAGHSLNCSSHEGLQHCLNVFLNGKLRLP